MTSTASPEPPRALPRELVLASAGAGKTFHLSSRVLGLLAAGTPPGELLASTFTRKAAGEILERTLLRLARAVTVDSALEELNEHALLTGAPPLTREAAGTLLLALCSSLHRLQIGTLDSFFHRVTRIFALELGLTVGWRVADEAESEALMAEAVEGTLDRLGHDALLELLQLLNPGESRLGVQGQILETAKALQRSVRELDPGAPSPWGFPGKIPEPPSEGAMGALQERLSRLEVPLTRKGTPHSGWVKGRHALAAAIETRDWTGVAQSALVANALPGGSGTFHGGPIPDPWAELLADVARAVHDALCIRYHRQMEARGQLANEFEATYRSLTESRGLFRFDDIPHLLVEGGELGSGDALFYRLDGRIRHLLLDEFQDTSTLQWRALEPLAGEILSGADPGRAGVIVADPKQSIYGWRGAEPALIRALEERHGLPQATLAKSWRTGGPILDAVNRIFSGAPAAGTLSEERQAVAREWMESFSAHVPAWEDRPGYVRVVAAPAEDHRRAVRPGLIRAAAAEVAAIREAAPGASIGVLCRTRAVLVRVVFELRSRGIPVSEEGGAPLGDAWGVHLMLAALRLADGGADRVSRYIVATSPLGAILGFADWESDAEAYRVSSRLRAELVEEGYGEVLDSWRRALGPDLPARDRDRLDRLVELAFRFDAAGGAIRPTEFVRQALAVRVASPGEEAVRVMTVHASKGLEFDAVVLPELEGSFDGPGGPGNPSLPQRETPDGPVTRILPRVGKKLEPFFPELREATRRARAWEFREELSVLYVALTRPRYALHIVVEDGRETKSTPAALVREGLGFPVKGGPSGGVPSAGVPSSGVPPSGGDSVLLGEMGDPEWMRKAPGMRDTRALPEDRRRREEPIVFARSSSSRALIHSTPSELAAGEVRSVADLLRRPAGDALRWGTMVHAWLEAIEWLDPDLGGTDPALEARLLRVAARADPGWDAPRLRLSRFLERLEEEPLRSLLSRSHFPDGTRVERELPFLSRQGKRLISGTVDRVVVIPGPDGHPHRAQVLDFKTDLVGEGEYGSVADRYRPQLEAYRAAVADRFALPAEKVEAALVFLEPGRLVPIE